MRACIALALAAALAAPTLAKADGDTQAGEKVFRKCKACHMVGDDAKARVGPVLNNIMGATAGTNEEYLSKYSKAMVEAGENGLVWTIEELDEYLTKPRDHIKGTKMAFAGLPKEADRQNVIAYLLQFSPDYQPQAEDQD